MKKKFKVLVPVVGYVLHEVFAENVNEAAEIGYEELVACGDVGDLHPYKIVQPANSKPRRIEVLEIDPT